MRSSDWSDHKLSTCMYMYLPMSTVDVHIAYKYYVCKDILYAFHAYHVVPAVFNTEQQPGKCLQGVNYKEKKQHQQ